MYIDFMGDKGGARLDYGDKFAFFDGDTLELVTPEYDIPNMWEEQDRAFINAVETGVKNRNNIEYILETMKLLDTLYVSAEEQTEVKF